MDADITQEKLPYLRNEINYLKSERNSLASFHQYVANVRLKKAVERSLQAAIELCLDIGRRLIALEGFRFPQDNQDVFKVLAEEKVVSALLLIGLQDFARFRNLIVHDYAKVDDTKVYQLLKTRLDDFDAFADAMSAYLET